MVASCIPLRAFAISALLVGAFSPACAAPVPTALKIREVEGRNCRILGCLFVESHPIKLLSERENEPLNAANSAVPLALVPEDLELAATYSRSTLMAHMVEPTLSLDVAKPLGDAVPIESADVVRISVTS